MKISIDNALGVHQHAMKLRSHRASVLANNIANADTPGYKARDFDFGKVLDSQMRSSATSGGKMATTDGQHLGSQANKVYTTNQYRVPLMPSLDQNTVDIQVEQSEFAKNNIEFLASLRFLNGKIQGLRSAIAGE